ncbi:MAG: eukaryotic-like serine/threonine-protein kinase [Acidobacteriota bacterium]|jgi:serine/threonine-protein kinase|nr:eukaryotic-like serine/threonine-protein kinase [Acidobacteriota bacterium]
MLTDAVIQNLQKVVSEPSLAKTRYELKKLIGAGGMGTVYLVHDRELARDVALKLVQEDLDVEDFSIRLRAEARTLAQLDHPGIVSVYDVGVLDDKRVYYTMKFIEGESLEQALKNEPSLAWKLRIFRQVCETIGFAHAREIVHLDLKPGNIIVAPFGETLVVDWGIARALSQTLPSENSSQTAGTPIYMAPEQLDPGLGAVSPATDVFALGRILLFMLTGRLNDNSVDQATIRGSLVKISRPLRAICNKALSKYPENRYPSGLELMEDITRFLDQKPVKAYEETWLEISLRWLRKNKILLYLLLAYLLMRVAVAVFLRK